MRRIADSVQRGTVFSITLHGKETVVHSFGYGTDGADPVASLIEVNGTFYGTTAFGGVSNCDVYGKCGTVFSITPSGNESVLHRFGGAQDGGAPVAPLIEVNGTLYGTTAYGGAYSCSGGGCGTIFSVTRAVRSKYCTASAAAPMALALTPALSK